MLHSIIRLSLAIALAGASCALASGQEADPRLPLFEKGEASGMRSFLAWPPGVRRIPAFLAVLQKEAAADIADFAGAAKAQGEPDKAFERYVQERFANDGFESVIVVTRLHGQPGEKVLTPRTWDIAASHALGWSDLLTDTSDNSQGFKAIYAYVARALGSQLKPKPPKPGDDAAAAEYQRLTDRFGWFAPTLEGMPGFVFTPAADGEHVGGLSLIFGKETPMGYRGDGPFADEVFVPAAVFKSHLTAMFRDLFEGEAARYGLLQRERDDATISGSTAVVLTNEQKPGKTLALRAEAPETFFNGDSIDLVVDSDAQGLENAKTFVATGRTEAGAKPSGVGYDLRVFGATINQKIEPFTAVCRQAALHIRPAAGSLADRAHVPPIDVSYPLKFDCSGDQG
ncbi:MAG TPA: hypothetical protein VKS78_06820 [Roseiarcus sp.]|nr:hypothetical protein [Roseiarcus sp.]